MKIARTIASWVGIVFVALVALAVILFGAIQTTPGKRMLASFASSMASTAGLTVSIEGIGGFVPSSMTVDKVTVADADGIFAQLDDLSLVWHPLSLLGGTVDVDRLGATRVAFDRMPVLPPADPAATTSGGGIPMLRVVLGELNIGDIAIGEPVIGMPANLGLQASARLVDPAEGLALNFAVLRKDAPGKVNGRVRYVPDDGKDTLVLDVTASEPAGGLVARLAAIEGLPPISLSIKGSAPLDDWNGNLVFDAADAGRIEGTGAVRSVEGGRRVMIDLGGTIAGLVPATIRPLFADKTTIMGSAVVGDDSNIAIEGLNLSAAGFGLALVGKLDTAEKTADITADLVGGDPAHFASFAPGVSWTGWRLNAAVSGAFATPTVNATLTAQGLSGMGYGAKDLSIVAKTTPNGGALDFTVDGSAAGLSANDPKVAAALGQTGTFSVAGSTGPNGPQLTKANVALTPVDLAFDGQATPQSVTGTVQLGRLDLAALSALAGRPLSGTIAMNGKIDTGNNFSSIALAFNGNADKVSTGIAAVDGFFADRSTIKGSIARSADGSITVNGLSLAADGLDLTVDGGIQKDTADLIAKLNLANLDRLDPRVSGAANAELRFSGGLNALGVSGTIDVPSARAMDKTIEKLQLAIDMSDLTGKPSGTVKLDGQIAGKPATGSARFAMGDTGQRVDNLDFTIGSVRAQGDAGIAANGIVDGRFTVAAGNLADLSALILTDIGGKLDATIVLDAANGVQRVAVNIKAQDIVFAGNRLSRADIDARIVNPAGVPVIDGKATLAGLEAGSQQIEKAVITAKSAGSATDVMLDTALLGASITGKANVAPNGGDMRIRLDAFRAAKGSNTVTLSAPANLTLSGGAVAIDRLALATSGKGAVTVSGRAGQTLDLNVDIRNLPLALASLAAPTLDLGGTLSGNARVTGPATAPSGNYQLNIARLTNRDIAAQGVGPFEIAARGSLGGGNVQVDATINAPKISGLTIRGSVPIAGGNLDLRIAGAIDLAIANTMLATSGSTVRGRATVDAALRGTTAAPAVSGTVRVAGATFVDSVNGITLTNIQMVLTGTDRAIQVTTLTAQTPNNGKVSGTGNVALDAARGFPASIQINLDRATLVSSELVRMIADGRITVEGPVATRPKIGGRIDVRSLDINIADKLPGGLDPLDVRHINTGGAQLSAQAGLRAAAKARAQAGTRAKQSAFVADLDLALAAPNGVFVRGMGIDAEFGGQLTVRGTTADPITLGGFELRRGRFDVLGRRLDFTQGSKVTFEGNTDPALDFTATTTSNDVTASIIVGGRASSPEVSFSSSPTLPQDEVLSRILFGRSVSTLNTSQALQVAQAIAQFSGGGPGVLDNVRRSLGVDSLDVDTSGNVGIGKRLNDRVYVGARQGPSAASGKVTVDVDVTRNIRLQGAVGADGSNELGLGAQWDY